MRSKINYWIYPGIKVRDRPSPERIISIILDFFAVSQERMESGTRKRKTVWTRQCICYFIEKAHPKMSLETIGRWIGGKDHATVIYSIKVVKDLMQTDKTRTEEVTELEELIFKK